MNDKNYFKFLGTAGARFVVARQLRYSAGIFLHLKGKNIMLDPGPGALLRLARSRPPLDAMRLDAIILTHAHIDHTSDANPLIDAMTAGGLQKRGALFAPDECIHGENRVILSYLREFLERMELLQPGNRYRLGDLSFTASVRLHHSAETYGILFDIDGVKLSFLPDTKYFPALLDAYRGSDILVMNVVRYAPHKDAGILHLSLDDVRDIVRAVKPKKALLTHLGMTMLKARPHELSRQLTDELGTEVIVASDGMTVEL